jgi:hypothetical protein
MKTPVYGKCGCLLRGENFPSDTRTEYLQPMSCLSRPKVVRGESPLPLCLAPTGEAPSLRTQEREDVLPSRRRPLTK